MKLSLLLTILFLLMTGCASLDVNVSVYNGPIPVSVQKVQSTISALENDSSGVLNKDFEESYIAKIIAVEKTINWNFEIAKCKEGKKVNNEKCLENASAKLDKELKRRAEDLMRDLHDVQLSREPLLVFYDKTNQTLLTAMKQNRHMIIGQGASHYSNLLIAWNHFYSNYTKLNQSVNTYLQQVANSDALKRDVNQVLVNQALSDLEPNRPERGGIATSGLLGKNALIVGSPLFSEKISAIIKDKDNWESINSSNFSAYWGDAQFVVVRKGLVEFRQKSLDFDPAPAVAAGSSITGLGLKVTSALATGQFPSVAGKSESSDENTLAPLPKVDQPSIDANQALLNRRLYARQEYLMKLADLYDEFNATPPSAEQLKKKLASAVALFEARLRLPKD